VSDMSLFFMNDTSWMSPFVPFDSELRPVP